MVRWFLSHEWKSWVRSAFWERSLWVNIILALLALYFGLNLLVLGFMMDDLLEQAFPRQNPFDTFNAFFLYYLLFDVLFRFFMQEFPLLDLQRYLLLPISRRKIFHYLLLKSIPGFFNLFPLLFILPFAFQEVFTQQSAPIALAWLALMVILVLINNFLAYYLKRAFVIRPVLALALLAVIIVLFTLDVQGMLPLATQFGTVIHETVRKPFWFLFPLGFLTGIYYLLMRVFGRHAYLDAMARTNSSQVAEGQNFEALARFGQLGKFLQLDLNLIRRNKRPRTMMVMAVIFLFYPLIFNDVLENDEIGIGFTIFISVVVTGMAMANYGQFMLSWESSFFDLFMGRNLSMRDYFESKFFLFLGFNAISTFFSLAYGLVDWRLPILFLAVAVYNVGVNSFLTMFFATFNTRRIDPDRQAFFNYEGVGPTQFLYTIPLFLGPIIVYYPFSLAGIPYAGIAAIAVAGILGIGFRRLLLDAITRQFRQRRYVIINGFKKTS